MTPKPIFDTVRTMLGRGFTPAEVEALDAAIARASNDDDTGPPVQTSAAGIALIHEFEGLAKLLPDGRVQAYPDPGTGGAPWTIGWGSTTDENGKPIKPGTIWTREQADKRFVQHLRQFERAVIAALGGSITSTTQAQFDAMVSFTYNAGANALASSTLLKLHKAGDRRGAAEQFARWNKAGGRVLAGLTRRRAAEAAMYRGAA